MILGQKVRSPVIYRRCEQSWVEVRPKVPIEGIYIGTRTLQIGYTEYYGDDGSQWITTGTFEAAFVVTHPRRNPIHVPIGTLESIP